MPYCQYILCNNFYPTLFYFRLFFYYFHLIFVDGSSHLEVFWKKSTAQILTFSRIIQFFVLKSYCFVFFGGKEEGGRGGWGGWWGTHKAMIWVVGRLRSYFYVFLAFCDDYFFCDTLSIGCWPALIPNFSLSLWSP